MQTNIASDSVNFSGIMGKEESSLGEKLGQENDDDSYFNLKKPESWSDCRSIIWNKSEEKVLKMQNPDGLLYLSYLKYCGQLFSLCKYKHKSYNVFNSHILLYRAADSTLHNFQETLNIHSCHRQLELLAPR